MKRAALAMHRRYANIVEKFARRFTHSPATIEPLESRMLFSLVPTNPTSVDLGSVWDDVSSATASNGQYIVATSVYQGDYPGFNYSLYDTTGTLITTGDQTNCTDYIAATGGGFSDIDVALNNSGVGAVAWGIDNIIHVQRLNLSDGSHLGSELTLTVPLRDELITLPDTGGIFAFRKIRIALDTSGNVLLGWQRNDYPEVKLDDSAEPRYTELNSIGFAQYNIAAQSWSSPTTVVESSVSGTTATTVSSFDLTANGDGSFVFTWTKNTLNLSLDEYDSITAKNSSSRVQFQRYDAAGAAVGSTFNVSTIAANSTTRNFTVSIASDSSGTFTVLHHYNIGTLTDVYYTPTQTYAFRQTFDKNGKALTADTRFSTTAGDSNFSVAYDSRHQLVIASWKASNYLQWDGKLSVQIANTAGTKVLSTDTLKLAFDDDSSEKLIIDIGISSDTHGLRVVYGVSQYEDGLFTQYYRQDVADLSLTLGASTLPRFASEDQTTKGDLTVTLSNIGSVVAKGTATFNIVLTSFDTPDSSDPVVFTFDQAINIATGSSKKITLKNVSISPEDFSEAGEYKIFVTVTCKNDATESIDPNVVNNTASLPVTKMLDSEIHNISVASLELSGMQQTLVPGDKIVASVRLLNNGNVDYKKEKMSIILRASDVDNESLSVDLATFPLTLNLKAGASTVVKIPLKITSALAVGSYRFSAILGADVNDESTNYFTDDYFADDYLQSASDFDLRWEFGNIGGRTGSTKLTMTNLDGSLVTYSLSGKGNGFLLPALGDSSDFVDDDNNPVTTPVDISFFGTDSSTAVTISAANGSAANIMDITANSELGSLTATRGMLYGSVQLKAIKSLTLSDMRNYIYDHTVAIDGPSTQQTTLSFGKISATTINSSMAIKSLTAIDIDSADINATTIGTLSVKGDKKLGLNGNLYSTIKLTGTDKDHDGSGDYGIFALSSVSVAGAFSGDILAAGKIGSINITQTITGHIYSTGSITSLSASYSNDLSVCAGVTTDDSGYGIMPSTIDDFIHDADGSLRNVTIGSVTFTNKVILQPGEDPYTPYTSDVTLAASYIGTVKLGMIDFGNSNNNFFALEPATSRAKSFGSISYLYEDGDSGKKISKSLTPASDPDLIIGIGVNIVSRESANN